MDVADGGSDIGTDDWDALRFMRLRRLEARPCLVLEVSSTSINSSDTPRSSNGECDRETLRCASGSSNESTGDDVVDTASLGKKVDCPYIDGGKLARRDDGVVLSEEVRTNVELRSTTCSSSSSSRSSISVAQSRSQSGRATNGYVE